MKKIRPLAILSFFFSFSCTNLTVEASSQGSLAKLLSVTLLVMQQTSSNWVNRYSTNITGQDIHLGYDVAPIDNSQTVVTGLYDEGSFIGEFNHKGNEVWSKYFPETYFSQVIKTTEEEFFVAGGSLQDIGNGTLFVPTLSKFDIDKDENPDDPFSLHWTRTTTFAFYSEIKDLAEGDDGSALIAGTAYGAFTDNSSFTFQPRMFVFKYDHQGTNLWGGVFSTPSMFDEANAIFHDKNGTLTVSGYSAYHIGNDEFVPALSFLKLNDSGADPKFHFAKVLLVGQEIGNVSLPDPSKGLVSLRHIQTSEGDYIFTGVLLDLGNTTYNETYQLFAAKTTAEFEPIWFRKLEAPYKSAGMSVAEGKDGHYFFSGYYSEHEAQQELLVLKLRKENGELLRARIFEDGDYNISAAFSLNITKNGNIIVVGGIAKNNNNTVDINYLLALWNEDMDDCRHKIEPNVSWIPVILGREFDKNKTVIPHLYAFGDAPTLVVQDRYFVEKHRLCKEDDLYLFDTNELEYGFVLAGFIVGGLIVLCVPTCLICKYVKGCEPCRTAISSCFKKCCDPFSKCCKACKPKGCKNCCKRS